MGLNDFIDIAKNINREKPADVQVDQSNQVKVGLDIANRKPEDVVAVVDPRAVDPRAAHTPWHQPQVKSE